MVNPQIVEVETTAGSGPETRIDVETQEDEGRTKGLGTDTGVGRIVRKMNIIVHR